MLRADGRNLGCWVGLHGRWCSSRRLRVHSRIYLRNTSIIDMDLVFRVNNSLQLVFLQTNYLMGHRRCLSHRRRSWRVRSIANRGSCCHRVRGSLGMHLLGLLLVAGHGRLLRGVGVVVVWCVLGRPWVGRGTAHLRRRRGTHRSPTIVHHVRLVGVVVRDTAVHLRRNSEFAKRFR